MNKNGPAVIIFIILFLIILAASSCASPQRSKAVLRGMGFEDIEITGWSPFSCGEGDTFSTGFKAKHPFGNPVEGVVCCRMFRNCTVRYKGG
jgi:hypothetical protein